MLSFQVEQFGRPLARALRETPVPQGSEVLLQVSHCGLCHSDVHLHDGYFDLGAGQRLDVTRSVQPPRTLGHEIAGRVLALGPEVDAAAGIAVGSIKAGIAVGDVRVAYPWIGCGRCAVCAAGEEHLCGAPRVLGVNRDGGFASHVLVPHPRYLLDAGTVDAAQACTCACAGLTAYSALMKLQGLLRAGEPLLIVGAGGVGLSAIRLAQTLLGVAPVVAEIDRGKWDIARQAGAADCIDPAAEGALKAWLKASGGAGAVVDFVGAAASFDFGFGALRKGGTLVCVGLLGGATPLVPAMVAMKAVRIVGSYVGTLAELRALLQLAATGALPPMPVDARPLSSAAQATQGLDDLRAGRVRGRVVFKLEESATP